MALASMQQDARRMHAIDDGCWSFAVGAARQGRSIAALSRSKRLASGRRIGSAPTTRRATSDRAELHHAAYRGTRVVH
ncbi:MAG TPA: hypothetical protein VIX73_35780 [Kofleriaceae bacterium]|jgi:hypothetical protein